ncbi:MAG: DUF222 domain-containing protein [Sporichthyaceae bacterium]
MTGSLAGEVERELDKALAVELWASVDGEVAELAKIAQRLLAKTKALQLKAVAELDSRGYAIEQGASGTANWLRHTLNVEPGTAKKTVAMAKAVAGPHSAVGAALASGAVDWEQAQAIVKSIDVLPDALSAEDVGFAREVMLEAAKQYNAADLRALGRAIRHRADPDGSLPPDKIVDKVRGASFHVHGDGTESLHWRDSAERIAMARAAMAALDMPEPAKNGELDPRTAGQRRADAMVLILEKLLRHGDLPTSRGRAPQVVVTVDLASLKGQPDATLAALGTGSALTAETVRRLMCDAEVTPLVLDPNGVPLSVGRSYRTVTPGIWTALVARDTGCVFPGCTQPAWMCRAHHLKYWENDGETSLENGALLCGRHHVTVHHRGWECRLGPDGLPELVPPPWLDPEQRPRRNDYWLLQRDLLRPPDLAPED